jgi:hypothetical protein
VTDDEKTEMADTLIAAVQACDDVQTVFDSFARDCTQQAAQRRLRQQEPRP